MRKEETTTLYKASFRAMSRRTVENYDRLQSLGSVLMPKFEVASPKRKSQTLSLEATPTLSGTSTMPFNTVYSNQNAHSITLEPLH